MDARRAICRYARSLFNRGYTMASSGNLSVRIGDRLLITATGTSFATLTPAQIAECDLEGRNLTGVRPSKEVFFHAAIYRNRPNTGAVVHLHAPYSLALSTQATATTQGNVLPVLTREAVVTIGRLPMLEYVRPGSEQLAGRIGAVCSGVNAILLQNHGMVAMGVDLQSAAAVAEELELCARLWYLTAGKARQLTSDEIADLRGVNP